MGPKIVNIRQLWLNYYNSFGFEIIPGAPLVHPSFPMSFNMSAGLVQLDPMIRSPKKVKPGKQVLIQKCFRHFDIDKVGDDTHLTFFEMPGAFEIGEFDEVKTVEYIWKFLTEILQIDQERLWITSFNKDEVSGTTISQPKRLINYLKTIAHNRLVLSDKRTNLWMQGGGINFPDNMRLVGPQVEFFYEIPRHCEEVASLPTKQSSLYCHSHESGNLNNLTIQQSSNSTISYNPLTHPENFMEIGNTIFIKYYIDYTDMTLKTLLNPSIEAVIGLERTVAVVENCRENIFQTTFFTPLINLFLKNSDFQELKIITNNLKSLLFILNEAEIKPGKNGRERIIRSLIRNLLSSFYVLKLNPQEFLPKLCDEIFMIYKSTFPDLKKAKKLTVKTILNHEKVFQKTLETGKRKIQKYMEENKLKKLNSSHKLYIQQNFGIPIKLLPIFNYANISGS